MKVLLLVLIVVSTMSCEKEFPPSYKCLSSYTKDPLYTDTSTVIYIGSFNEDTSEYPNSNHIKTILIKAIRHERYLKPSRSIQTVVSYTTDKQKDTTKYSLYYTGNYSLINIFSGKRLSDSVIQYDINEEVRGSEIFSCYAEWFDQKYLRIIAPPPTPTGKRVPLSEVPKIFVYDYWRINDLVTIGNMYNSILFQTNDSTINYNFF